MRKPLIAAVLTLATAAAAQDLASFEKKVTLAKLDNGLTVIIVERHDAPIFSYQMVVNAGGAQDLPGTTGVAHMFEHMAFKGTDTIGTSDAAAEKSALDRVEQTYAAYDAERRKPAGRNDAKAAALEREWKDAITAAGKYVVPNEFSKIINRAGAVGVNATTGEDFTAYFYSMPSNRVALWACLESQRFLHPVMREFYKERDVVFEERRLRTESDPEGRVLEQFVTAAYMAHPYGTPEIGWPSDLSTISAEDAMRFYRKYYVPSNMVVAVVGDVTPSELLPLLQSTFGRLPKAPPPEPLRTVEPPQRSERTVVMRDAAQPFYFEGYHRPAITEKDDAVYEVIGELLGRGRTARLYKSMVRDTKVAVVAGVAAAWPGRKYPTLFAIDALPTPGHSAAEMAAPIRKELERLGNEDVTAEELASVKARAKSRLVHLLAVNSSLAYQLAAYQTLFDDWRELFRYVDRLAAVTPADIRRVAKATFVANNRTVARLESKGAPE
ncbi:MAG TPA: pitrilysin family protein [Thermoanaerobaculia bacterium]|nr:pitrilysin family protein [Thermoanaerobaculia bacterium]